MKKIEGWESLLNATIESYFDKPFIWGQSDCLCFMTSCMKAVSGIDLMETHRGTYHDEETAFAMLGTEGYEQAFIGLEKITKNMAQRGDVGLIIIEKKTYCGVVAMDARHFLLRTIDGGLRRLALDKIDVQLWRIE